MPYVTPPRSRSSFHRICNSIPTATGSMPKVNKICICNGLAAADPILDKKPPKAHQKMPRSAYQSQTGKCQRSVGIRRCLGFLPYEAVLVFDHLRANPKRG